MLFKKSKLTIACLGALLSHNLAAQEFGSLKGLLTDARQTSHFAGAQVKIKELGLTTVSQRDGSFRFIDLPEGNYTLEISYLGADTITTSIAINADETLSKTFVLESATDELENVIVYGQRAGQASALNQQRTSDSIKSIVSADAIGQFPDQNAAEALQRLPGLSIERDQGEGRFVGIRGIDPNLNNVTINGLNVPSPEGGVRSVALDVIPSELISALEVSKSVTPDMDGDAIGGSVEVKSLNAFDSNTLNSSITLQTSQNDLRDKNSPKISGSVSNVFNQKLGVAAAVSYFDRDFGSDNIESNGDDEVEQRYYTINRERLGAALNLDFRPDQDNQYYIRSLYSRFSDDEYRMANTFTFDGDDSEIERGSKDRFEEQSILSITTGAEHQLHDWLVEYQLGYSKADEDEPDSLYYTFKGDGFPISSNMKGKIPVVVQNSAAMRLGNYELDEIEHRKNYAEDIETSFKIDITRMVDVRGFPAEIKFGGKYRDREKNNDALVSIYDGDFDGVGTEQFSAPVPDWGLGDFGDGLNKRSLRNYYNQQRNALELVELDSELKSNSSTYSNEEDILAVYLMGKVDVNDWRIVAGLRYEDTDFSTSGMRVELIENEETDTEEVVNTPWQSQRSYDHLLPSLNIRYAFSDELIGRFAFTKTISRPKFEDAAAFQIIESKTKEDDGVFVTEREAEVGNPELRPFESGNIDLSLEYYPGDIGVLSIGYFHKSIDNFIVMANVAGTPGWEGFDEVSQLINGESATVDGLELSWVKTFDNGFLISANGTFSDSDAETLLDGKRFKTSLPNQSDEVGNLTLGYENDTVSLRLTMSYKSENFEELDGDLMRMEDDHQQLDFMAKYFATPNLMLYLNAININDEPFYNYFDSRTNNAQYEEYGRTIEVGLTWSL